MFIEFTKLKFKNVLSYGSKETVVDLTTGLNSIMGINGQGKSTLLDALSFCLFGQPYRKIKLKDLVNRVNKKNLWTQCTFRNGVHEYEITRSLNPAKMSIKKDGNDLDLLSSKKLNQGEIDAIIGVDYKLFKQIICLAINYNQPFLSLSAGDKREIIESIFNIKIFGMMATALKKEQSSLKVEGKIHGNTLGLLEVNLKSLRNQVKTLELTEQNFDAEKQLDLRKSAEIIKNHKSEISKTKRKITTINKSIKTLNYDGLDELREELNDIISQDKVSALRIKDNLSKISSLKNEDECPLCGNGLDEDHKATHLETLSDDVGFNNHNLIGNKFKIDDINEKIKSLETVKSNFRKAESILERTADKLELLTNQLKVLHDDYSHIEDRSLNIDIDSAQKELTARMAEYQSTFKMNKLIVDDIETNVEILGILSEKGIKSFFFKKLTPLLNAKVNEYLELFGLPIILEFDELMEESITTVNRRDETPYMGFSEGEKKRIDISILLSFIEITKSISNWNCNLLVMDEILDTSIDKVGLDAIITGIEKMKRHNPKLCIYIISHKVSDIEYDQSLVIGKQNGFSNIKVG